MKHFLVATVVLILVAAQGRAQLLDPFGDEFKDTLRLKNSSKPLPPPKELPNDLPPTALADKFEQGMQKWWDYIDVHASIAPTEVRRGQVAQIVLSCETKHFAYVYSAIKRTLRQSGKSAEIEYAGDWITPWVTPLYPLMESGTEFYKFQDETSFILHGRFQWKQDIYINPCVSPGPHEIAVKLSLGLCTKEDAVAKTVNECYKPGPYKLLTVNVNVSNEPPLPPPSDLETRMKPPTVEVDRPFSDLAGLLFSAFVGAILMLLTPCVFPMIPITVNFFIKQSEKEHHRPFFMATVYAGTIVVLLTVVILLIGKSIIDLANEPWFNLGLGVVLILFALGLFGMFDVDLTKFFGTVFLIALGYGLSMLAKRFIPYFAQGESEFLLALASIVVAVPVAMVIGRTIGQVERALGFQESFVLNFLSSQESRGGILGAAFMAMTFTITSFSCTGPFLGILLAPLAGTSFTPSHLLLAALVYSVTFAAPFFLLALFPTYLKKLPKSGGWMTTIKVTMGFLEIGAALKFLANTDLFWFPGSPRLFTYDTVLCSWIALCLACSLYLFNVYHLNHDTPEKHLGVPRMIFGSLFLGMALYLTPLLFGVMPAGVVMESAVSFLPPNLKKHGDIDWIEDDYMAAWKVAKKENKYIFIDFTGQNCANCRANERNAFTRPNVVRELKSYVCLQLYTDSVPNPYLSAADARRQAQEQQAWQIGLVNGVTNPQYVIFEPDPDEPFDKDGKLKGRVVSQFRGYIDNVRAFADLLSKSLRE